MVILLCSKGRQAHAFGSRLGLALIGKLQRKFEDSWKSRPLVEKTSASVNDMNNQTDIKNFDLKELKQALALIKQKRAIENELQDVKDRICQLQFDLKLKIKENSESLELLNN